MTTQIILHEAYNFFIFGYGKTVIDIFFLRRHRSGHQYCL